MTYKNGVLYKGNIVKKINDNVVIVKEDIHLFYNQKDDSFYDIVVLNYMLDLELNKNLTKEEIEAYQNKVNEHKYGYIELLEENKLYIDESSIYEIKKDNKQKN